MSDWRQRVEYASAGSGDTWRILGEDDHGDLWAPSRARRGWWDRRFNPRNPLHWRYWLHSRLTRRIAWLEAGGE
jgi:hypothetical protein